MSLERVVLQAVATPQNFDEVSYLASNPDVEVAVRAGRFPSGRAHFDCFGKNEGRKQTRTNLHSEISALREKKLTKLTPHLRTDMAYSLFDGRYDFLTTDLRELSGIVSTDNVSCNSYDGDLWGLIESTPDGIILDCGAGRRDVYLSNVVNFEIAPYDTTDILGVGENLPFEDNAFDGLISVAVLEHVKFPLRCADEICRVLKPGGWIFCSVPFLQPYHGYPHHYFNMTHQGLKSLFEAYIEIKRQFVNPFMTPVWALNWMIKSWADGLPVDLRQKFLDLRLGDIAGDPAALIGEPYVLALTEDKNFELACATVLIGEKKR